MLRDSLKDVLDSLKGPMSSPDYTDSRAGTTGTRTAHRTIEYHCGLCPESFPTHTARKNHRVAVHHLADERDGPPTDKYLNDHETNGLDSNTAAIIESLMSGVGDQFGHSHVDETNWNGSGPLFAATMDDAMGAVDAIKATKAPKGTTPAGLKQGQATTKTSSPGVPKRLSTARAPVNDLRGRLGGGSKPPGLDQLDQWMKEANQSTMDTAGDPHAKHVDVFEMAQRDWLDPDITGGDTPMPPGRVRGKMSTKPAHETVPSMGGHDDGLHDSSRGLELFRLALGRTVSGRYVGPEPRAFDSHGKVAPHQARNVAPKFNGDDGEPAQAEVMSGGGPFGGEMSGEN